MKRDRSAARRVRSISHTWSSTGGGLELRSGADVIAPERVRAQRGHESNVRLALLGADARQQQDGTAADRADPQGRRSDGARLLHADLGLAGAHQPAIYLG